MTLNLSTVLSKSDTSLKSRFRWEVEEALQRHSSFQLANPVTIDFLITPVKEHSVKIEGTGVVTVRAACDRCLLPVTMDIPLHILKEVEVSKEGKPGVEDFDEINYIIGYNFDEEQLVCNELLVGWPMKILCSENCKGICNVCGQDLNQEVCDCDSTGLDPRMSVIQEVFKNFKEV